MGGVLQGTAEGGIPASGSRRKTANGRNHPVLDAGRGSQRYREDEARKGRGPDGVPVEAWKVLGNCGVNWLTSSSTVTIVGKMPDDWRDSITVSIFKQKGDASECSNYRGIKDLTHDEGLRTAGRLEAMEAGRHLPGAVGLHA
ncbi:unnamed protein product [Heligmosomoides polygyrus]|uniref:Uncharacterized protein n=1 Tax=Heligmosomoides polygyrus TaxID=6339 RepID=A0A183G913_HELPZ|nr:unnamed protein product [Heligmosomoides polygyrus]